MATTMDALRIRQVLGRKEWTPPERFGPDGWRLDRRDLRASIIVTAAEFDGATWLHASVAGRAEMPTYDDLVLLHRAVFGSGYAYQVFTPPAKHVNIHQYALHLWGRADGKPAMPEFGANGSI